jgi:hypothetical protein
MFETINLTIARFIHATNLSSNKRDHLGVRPGRPGHGVPFPLARVEQIEFHQLGRFRRQHTEMA